MPSVVVDSAPHEEHVHSEERKEDKIKGKDVPEECEKVIKTEIKVEGEEKEDDDEDEANRSKKKIKLDDSLAEKDSEETNNAVKPAKVVPAKCTICRQLLNDPDLILYEGHPNNAVEEFVALTDPKLALFTGEEEVFNDHDERPQNKITHFSVYDKNGHLCPFDSGLIERNVLLYFSGYVKPIYDEAPEPEGGIPTYDLGPINMWYVSGYDGGEKALISFSTAYGEYFLMEPSEAYAPVMKPVNEKNLHGQTCH